jgi:hypothetical protein
VELPEILKQLNTFLALPNWADAGVNAKIQVIRLLNIIWPTLSDYAKEEWLAKVGGTLNIQPKILAKLVENVDELERNLPLLAGPGGSPIPQPKHRIEYPKDGWIGRYLEYTLNSEAPLPFHFWTAVSIIGGVLGRQVHFAKGHYRVYPNHFIILIAPTGRCRKSSAIAIGVKLLRHLDSINILAEKITPEALVEALTSKKKIEGTRISEDCSGFIHAPELAVFLGKQVYNEGLVALLTGLSDNPDKWEYRTRTKSTVHLQNVNLSLLGASTPDWLYDSIPQSAFGGGFMSRIIFVVQTKTDRVMAFPPPENELTRDYLIEKLRLFADTSTQFTNSPAGEKWYEDWYNDLANTKAHTDDPRLAGYFERKPDHLIRLAMVLAVGKESGPILEEANYTEALNMLDTLEIPMPDAFLTMDEAIVGANARRVLKQLAVAENAQMGHSRLLQKNYRYMDKKQFKSCMETLHEAGMVDIMDTGKKVVYRLLTPIDET